jgi:hypothetical protein
MHICLMLGWWLVSVSHMCHTPAVCVSRAQQSCNATTTAICVAAATVPESADGARSVRMHAPALHS